MILFPVTFLQILRIRLLQEDEEEDEETLTLDQETMDDAVDTFDDDENTGNGKLKGQIRRDKGSLHGGCPSYNHKLQTEDMIL